MLILPAQEYLRQVFDYDSETGVLRWKMRADKNAQWNGQFACKAAGNLCPTSGYVRVRLDGKLYVAHRIIFKWMTGEEPNEFLDHINGNRVDNRWTNIRRATLVENNRNCRTKRKGLKGAFPIQDGKYWYSQIGIDKKYLYLGCYYSELDAHKAYVRAAEEYHGAFACVGRA